MIKRCPYEWTAGQLLQALVPNARQRQERLDYELGKLNPNNVTVSGGPFFVTGYNPERND